jgi:hypothetical protein
LAAKDGIRYLARRCYNAGMDKFFRNLSRSLSSLGSGFERDGQGRREAWAEIEEIISESHQNIYRSNVAPDELEGMIDAECNDVRYGGTK